MQMKFQMNFQKIKELGNKLNLNLGILALIIIIYLFFFCVPKIKNIVVDWIEVSKLKQKVVSTEKTWKNLESLKTQITLLKGKLNSYEQQLSNEKEVPLVLEYLSSAAKKLNVRINEIRPGEPDQDKEKIGENSLFYPVPILVKAECGYHQLGRLVNELEKAERFMKISDLEIAFNPRNPRTHYVQLTVVTYVMKK